MKNCYLIVLFFMFSFSINAQVGINTNNPKSTLHVQKRTELTFADGIIPPRISGDSLRLKEAAYGPAQNGAIVYVTSAIPSTTGAIKTLGVTTTGLFSYDASATNTAGAQGLWIKVATGVVPQTPGTGDGAYAARISKGLSILQVGINLLSTTMQLVALPTATNVTAPNVTPAIDINVDIGSLNISTNIGGGTGTNAGDSYYTVPSTGIYNINYSYRTGQGLRAEVLSGTRPGLVITKTASGSTTPITIDYRLFGGLQLLDLGVLGLVNVSLTQGQISHIYQLTAGDRIRFGVLTGGLALGVLTDSSAEISIYKIR